MERWIYRRAERVVVISEGFRRNLLEKGVGPAKVLVAPIGPTRNRSFREAPIIGSGVNQA